MFTTQYTYYVAPQTRMFCSDAHGTSLAEIPKLYFGERPVFAMQFDDDVLVAGETLILVLDNDTRFLDSHSTTGLDSVMAWAVHEITTTNVNDKLINLDLYCFGRKYASVINGHNKPVSCILALYIKSIDANLNTTFSLLATTLANAEPTIISPDCVFDTLPLDMYLTRDEMNALLSNVESIQQEAIQKAEQAHRDAQELMDMTPLVLDAPPTIATAGKVGRVAVYRDAEEEKDYIYHLAYITTSDNFTAYHWEPSVLESQRNVANGFAGLGNDGKIALSQLKAGETEGLATLNKHGKISQTQTGADGNHGIGTDENGLYISKATNAEIDGRTNAYKPLTPENIDYAVRFVLSLITVIEPTTDEFALLDASATTNNHSHDFRHAPSAVPTYIMPDVPANNSLVREITLEVEFPAYARSSDDDSGSAFAWKHGADLLYTDTSTPTAGTTVAYSDAALTTSAGVIQAYQNDAIGLVISCNFEDTGGTTIVPKEMASEITCGTVIQYLCEYTSVGWTIWPLIVKEGA